jgi:pimeloyl-ACP methyl ester carboxylesterase
MLFAVIPLMISACASQPPNPSFAVSVADADAAVERMRAEPKALQRPLVIVGGFWDPNFSPTLLKGYFRRIAGDDRKIVTVAIGFSGSFWECREKIIDAVDEAFPSTDPTWTSEVDVIGASLGGLAARHAAAPAVEGEGPRRLRIKRLFSIGSPHCGATLAKTIALTEFHRDMRPDSAFLKRLAAEDAGATYDVFPYVWLGDEIVGERYASPPGVNPLWLPALPMLPPHAGAMMDSRILGDIGRRLRGEEGFAKVPGVPLPETGI